MSSCLTSESDEGFLRCRWQRFDFAVQNYNKKMIYARKGRFFCKNVQIQFGRNGQNWLSGIAARSRQQGERYQHKMPE